MSKSNVIYLPQPRDRRSTGLKQRELVSLGLFDPGTVEGKARFVAACRDAARKGIEEN
jgi:hypothetical protein